MPRVETDEHGRIPIPQEVRERYGEEYLLVELQSNLKLIPIPEEPLETLRSAGSEELESVSTEGIREVAVEVVRDDANPDPDDG